MDEYTMNFHNTFCLFISLLIRFLHYHRAFFVLVVVRHIDWLKETNHSDCETYHDKTMCEIICLKAKHLLVKSSLLFYSVFKYR